MYKRARILPGRPPFFAPLRVENVIVDLLNINFLLVSFYYFFNIRKMCHLKLLRLFTIIECAYVFQGQNIANGVHQTIN